MSLAEVAKQLDWYSEDEILNPSGYGAKVYAELVKKKIERTLKFERNINDVKVGVLVNDPASDKTQLPIAIICEFQSEIETETLNLTHKLSWNFCRSPLLIIIEPTQVRALSCFIEPQESVSKEPNQLLFEETPNQEAQHKAQILQFPIDKSHSAHQAAEHLRWIDLYTGQFIREQEKNGYFPTKQRVDYKLLENLKFIREELIKLELEEDVVHDLLARLIFIQFLFQRKDSKGKPAIDKDFLEKLWKDEKILSKKYSKLQEILENKEDTYNFFRKLNDKFNGDLFPGKGETEQERENEWKQEMDKVEERHLKKLASFISGKEEMKNSQLCLWERYSFDVIPLEFISSIYEVFVNKDKGVHYTPSHLVDFILDNPNVLPWNETKWDLKILDPACGSGIFLVKAFQRLVQRWKNANEGKKPDEAFLVGLLANNLNGIDINPHAVRVASFSLYLAICDEIDPRRLMWQNWEFPSMRDERIIKKDFFDDLPLFEKKYDVIIGNAPWGRSEAKKSEYVKIWAENNNWKIPNQDIGPLFLPRAALMTNPNGVVAMLQPVNNLLFNQSGRCLAFRRKLFTSYKTFQIVNLSALRFGLFSNSISPSCIVVLTNSSPDEKSISYICPKGTKTQEDIERILIEYQDESFIYSSEAINNPLIWTTLMWGSRRDLNLMKRLIREDSIKKHSKSGNGSFVNTRRGINKTSDRAKTDDSEILKRKVLDEKTFPPDTFLTLDTHLLRENNDPKLCKKETAKAFKLPQLIVKLGWQTKIKRFRAEIVKSKDSKGVLCSDSYATVHTQNKSILESACLSYNSKLAVYFLMLLSGRFTYRQVVNTTDILEIPIAEPRPNLLKGIDNFDDIDKKVYELFDLKDSEKILIDDLFEYTLPDFIGNSKSEGREKTERENEPELNKYCDIFRRVIKAGFGSDTTVFATIFQEQSKTDRSPVRMIKFDLDVSPLDENKTEPTSYESFWKILKSFAENFNQRVYKGYEPKKEGVGITVYFVKPDQKRYWLRSQAYRDADEVFAEINQSVYRKFINKLPNLKKEKKVA